MEIQSMSGAYAPVYDRKTFGAAVVGKTLDYMHGGGAPKVAPFDRETFGAAVVSTTIDYMNTNTYQHRNQNSYTFQTDVLMPVYTGRGTLLDSSV